VCVCACMHACGIYRHTHDGISNMKSVWGGSADFLHIRQCLFDVCLHTSSEYWGLPWFPLKSPLKLCAHHIQLMRGLLGDALLLVDAGRGFKGLLSIIKLIYSFRNAQRCLQTFLDLSFQKMKFENFYICYVLHK